LHDTRLSSLFASVKPGISRNAFALIYHLGYGPTHEQ